MSPFTAPLIRKHERSAARIAADVIQRLGLELGLGPEDVDPPRDAIVRVFARYCEILIERLNRVPEHHHLAFLNLLGASPLPAVPARAPLSFKPVGGPAANAGPVVVPQHTQVAAPAEGGESEPVVFETIADLQLIRAQLERAVAVDVRRHVVAHVDEIASPAGLTGTTMFSRAATMTRAVYFGHRAIFGAANLTEVRLHVEADSVGTLPTNAVIEWGIAAQTGIIALTPARDTTLGLTGSGDVAFRHVPEWPTGQICDMESNWLTCRLRMGHAAQPGSNGAGAWRSAHIARIRISASAGVKAAPVAGAFYGPIPLDISRDFFPLGERPRFGDVFYLGSETFATAGARVMIAIKLTNPTGADATPIPPVSRAGNPRLIWETYTNRGWIAMDFDDETRSLTQDGDLAFTVPEGAARTAIGGMETGWMRARLSSGSYVVSGQTEASGPLAPMAPPSIAAITVNASVDYAPVAPEHIVIESNLECVVLNGAAAQTFTPFPPADAQGTVLYVGIVSSATELAGRTLSFYVSPANRVGRVYSRDILAHDIPMPRWQVRGATRWHDCAVQDQTHGMRFPGIIEVRLGDDVSHWRGSTLDPQQKWFWLRIVWDAPDTADPPCVKHLVLNTIPALQAVTLSNELLGSSNGRPAQVFHAARAPIIGDVTLEVREPGTLIEDQSDAAAGEVASAALLSLQGSVAQVSDTWVRWSCVDDFSRSDERSRHFTLDRLTGTVCFGDSKNGRIPPPGANNVRLRGYRTGGGKRGNRPAQTITQLRTTIPYVESVSNYEPSSGGQDTEDQASLRRSAAAWLRHRDRAVCADDYADLARRASPEVAQAVCIAARDMVRDQTAPEAAPGVVSVVVVPRTEALCPQPSLELVSRVREFLDARRPIGVDVAVLGPEYVRVGVHAEIVWAPGLSAARAVDECDRTLTHFLHPITGGPDGAGWAFGQLPHESDFYPLLGAVEGVDYIRSLRLRIEEERPGLLASGSFLICTGMHEVRLCH